jgi:uncharacterized protein
MVLRHREGLTAVASLVVLLAGLIAYKTGPALRAIHAAQATGGLTLRPYLANSPAGAAPLIVWTESMAYLRIIWPALVFGILIAAAARIAIPQEWFAPGPDSGLRATFLGAASGAPLMLCSCCAAPVFEGIYRRTRRLDTSLALLLAAPALNPAALVLTFILFPVSVTAMRLALTMLAFFGIVWIGRLIATPVTDIALPSHSKRERQSLLAAYSNSVLHVSARTLPLILAGIPVAILMFNYLRRVPSFAVSNSFGLLILFIGTVLLLPLPTLFEIPLAYSLLLIGAPLGMVAAVLFAGAAINLPSLLIVGRTAGIKASLLLAGLVGGLATGTALAFLR